MSRKHLNGHVTVVDGIMLLKFEDRRIEPNEYDLTEETVRGLFKLAGFEVINVWKLANDYWPEAPSYYETILLNPWWLIKTEYGLVKIGPRKRVLSIEWDDLDVRTEVTNDDVTKSSKMVHAWDNVKALEYLTNLCRLCKEAKQVSPA